MRYVIEQYRWENEDGYKYYHLVDSKEFESDKSMEDKDDSKDGSLFSIYKINENEVQTTRRTSRTTSRKK